MELCLDTETPENKVLSWLSQTDMPASIRNNCEEANATLSGTSKNNSPNIKNVSNSDYCGDRQLPKHYLKGGLNKYFSSNCENDVESASSDSGSELQENARSNRLYCDAERNLIIRYIAERKLFPFLKGNTIWKQMEKERICCRTWQSMKTQFHKYIYPHLEHYDLSDTDRSYFTRSMARSPLKKTVGFHSPGQRGWRKNCKFYTFIEDAMIIYYILEKDRYEFAYGNTLWQRMESKHIVPGRSWHSMKSRYKNFLSKYIERVSSTVKKGNKSPKKKLGPVEKTRLLQDFMIDHLNDMASTIGWITDSNKSWEERRCLYTDSSFSIPLPENYTNFTEREVIKMCVWDIAQQLDEKFYTFIENSNKTSKKCGEIINVFSPKYYESLKWREQSLRSPEGNYDLSESVQLGLKISTCSQSVKRHLFESSPTKIISKPCTVVNHEKSACSTFDGINSENIVLERIMHVTEKLEAGIKDCPYNADEDVCKSLVHKSPVAKGDVHTLKKTSAISQNTGNAEETTVILNYLEIRNKNPLGNTLQEDYMASDTITSIKRMPESLSSVDFSRAPLQNDELSKLPKLTRASAGHFFCDSKIKDTKEVNESYATVLQYSNICEMTGISGVELRGSSVSPLGEILALKIQELNNNKQSNLHSNSLNFEAFQKKAKSADTRSELCSSEVHTYSVSLNVPENTFSIQPLDFNVQSDHGIKNKKYCISEESNVLDCIRMSKSVSDQLISISNRVGNDELSTCSSAHVNYVEQNSKDLIVDDSCWLESSATLNSSDIFTRKSESHNIHTQLQDRSEVEPELRLHLSEESESEPDLRLHLSEDDSEEEPEMHLHISEDESEGEHELKQATEDKTGKIQEVPNLSPVPVFNFKN